MKDIITEKFSLFCGDCIEIMKSLPEHSVDCVICDLPYGITQCDWDNIIPFDKLWEQYNRITKENSAILLFSKGLFTVDLICSNRENFKYNLVWKKNVPTGMSVAKHQPMRYYEHITVFYKKQPTYNPILKPRIGVGKSCYNYDHYCGDNNHIKMNKGRGTYNPIMKERVGVGKACYKYNHYCGKSNHLDLEKKPKQYDPNFVQPSDVLEFNVVPNRKGKLHPTQKPTELIEWLIKTYSNEGELILDNCIGCGTTAIACMNANRNYIGFENNEEYYNISIERINNLKESKKN